MNKVVVAVFLLAKVFHATSNVLAGRVANDCAPILLQPSPGSPISFGQDITVTVEPGCCHTESRKLEDCIVAVFTDAVFEGFAAAFDDESAELKLTLPRFGMSNLGGHVISIAECGRGQEFEDLNSVKHECAVSETMVWISHSNTAVARANLLNLRDTFTWTSNWDRFVDLSGDFFLDQALRLPDSNRDQLSMMLHLRPGKVPEDSTRWTFSVVLNFDLIAEWSAESADAERLYVNGECISPGYKIHLQLPPNLPVHTMLHLSILVSNHRSGGAIAFSTLLVLAPRPLPDPSDLTAAAAVSLLAKLSLGPSINQRSLIRRQPNGRSAGLECNGSASVGLCESSDSSEDDGERGGEAGLRETFSVSDQLASYHVALKQATSDRKTFARFRSLRSYTYVLEGAGAWYAMVCREVMVRQTEWMDRMLPRIAKTSDAVGGPRTVWLPSPGVAVQSAPQTVVYCKVASDLFAAFGALDGMRVVEIGGGYGGQMKVAVDLFAVSQYVMIDLSPALELQRQYLAHHQGALDVVQWVQAEDRTAIAEVGASDLLISNYAWIECSLEDRDWYWDHVLAHAKRGYIVSNGPWSPREIARIRESKPSVRRWKVPDGLRLFKEPHATRADLPVREECLDADWRHCIVVWG